MAGEVLTFSLGDDDPAGEELLTLPGGIGLYRRKVALALHLKVGEGMSADIRFENCFVRIGAGGDSFLELLIPGLQESAGFDFGFRWDTSRGVSFSGGGALEATIPLRAQLPFVKLNTLHIIAKPEVNGPVVKIPIELSVDAAASLLGVIDATVERMGLIADFYISGPRPDDVIPIGPFAAQLKGKGPSGAGLSVNIAGVLSGGGFLSIDTDKGQYSGVLSLQLLGLSVTAIAIITTKPAFSLFAMISVSFRPVGLDIGFGFTINAVGGLLGLHRSADLKALAQAVRDNAIASIMFPADPVANAPRILRDLDRTFPTVQNQFLVGPMLEVGWGKPAGMFTLSVGVIIEVPDPKIAILGILKVLVPPLEDAAILRLQVNFIGSIDAAQQFLRFDASLYDSRLVFYSLEGDMAARLRWGANANFAVSVGGFNPRFVPAADLEIPSMRRVSVNLIPSKDNPRLRMESYYAATSNTLQHGARIELYAVAAGFGIKGFLGYDLLAQVSPLYFSASFGGAVAVLAGGEEIMSLGIDLLLEGPSPFHVQGSVSFKILFIRIRIGIDETFGSTDAPAVPEFDVAAEFNRQIGFARNWTAALPAQGAMLVQLVPRMKVKEDDVLAHPSAVLEFNQRAIPLKQTLQRFGAAKPVGPAFFDVAGLTTTAGDLVGEPVQTEFAPAQFFELTNDQKMSSPAFKELDSGFRANAAALVRFAKPVERDFGYEDGVRDAVAVDAPLLGLVLILVAGIDSTLALDWLGGASVARSELFKERVAALPTGQEVKINPGRYRIVDASTQLPVTGVGALSNEFVAAQTVQQLVTASPALAGQLAVLPEHELV